MTFYLKSYLLFCCAHSEVTYVQPCLFGIPSNGIYVASNVQNSDTERMENSPTRDGSYDSFVTKFRFLFKHTLKCKSTPILFAY
jgi:hypothetical protein